MSTTTTKRAVNDRRITDFCARDAVAKLWLFGSVLREDFRPDSDPDVLIEFKPGARVSLFDIGGMTMELRDIFGREVDLRTARDLSPYFCEEVVRGAELIYAATD